MMNNSLLSLLPKAFMPKQVYVGEKSLTYLKSLVGETYGVVISQSFLAANKELLIRLFGEDASFITHTGEPTLEAVTNIKTQIQSKKYTQLIGIGGGSVLDLVKFIKKELGLPMIAIPTTIGSSAEVSQHVVILEDGKKKPYSSPDFIPDVVLLAPQFVQTIATDILQYGRIDALAHGLESLVSRAANPLTDTFALSSLDVLFTVDASIEQLQVASLFAGIAQSSAATGLAHAFAHCIGAKDHIPHAKAVSIFLPDVIALNIQHTDKYQKLDTLKNISSESLLDNIQTLYKEIQITPIKISYTESIDTLAQEIKKDICTITNPYAPTIDDIMAILKNHQ